MRKDSATALTPTNAKQSVPPRSAPVGSRNSTANTRARNSASEWANNRHKVEEAASFPSGRQRRPLQRTRDAGPQFPIKRGLRAFCQKVSICVRPQHRAQGGTRPGHQRGTHFWLLEQPHFELRQKNKLFENGALQIVHEHLSVEFLSSVKDTWNLARISPARIRPFCRDAELRFQQ